MDDLTKASNQFNLPQHIITLVSNDSGYALDDQNEVFYLLLHVNSSNACALSFDYNSLIDAEVKEFNSDSGTARKIGRAVVGDVLFGDVGAIVGAVSTSALYNVELIIKTTNLKNPSNTYTLCSYAKQGSIAYESAHYFGEKIVAVVNNIAKQYHGSIGAGKSPNIDPDHIDATITRIELFLEDKEWQIARTYCDGALDYAPDNSMLYLLRCCANEHQSSLHDLIVYSDLNQNNPDYIKALRFADAELKETLDNYGQERKCEDTYNKAIFVLDTGDDALQKKDIENSANAFIQGRNLLLDISDYKDACALISDCQGKLYSIVANKKENTTIESVAIAQKCLRELGEYKDSDELIHFYNDRNSFFKKIIGKADNLLQRDWSSYNDADELQVSLKDCVNIGAQKEANELQEYINNIEKRERNYKKANQLLNTEKLSSLTKAKEILSEHSSYKKSRELILECDAKIQNVQIEKANVRKKIKKLVIIGLMLIIAFSIFFVILRAINQSRLYKEGVSYYNRGKYKKAITTFSKIKKYKDSKSYIINSSTAIQEKKKRKEREKKKKEREQLLDYINGNKSLVSAGEFVCNAKQTQEILYEKYKNYNHYEDLYKDKQPTAEKYYVKFDYRIFDSEFAFITIFSADNSLKIDRVRLYYDCNINSKRVDELYYALFCEHLTANEKNRLDEDIKLKSSESYEIKAPDEGISITLTYYSDYTKSTDPESTDPEGECEWDSDGEYFDDGSGYYVVSVE